MFQRLRHANVLVRRFEAPDLNLGTDEVFGGNAHAEGEELSTGIILSQAGVEKTRGTVVMTGPECRTLRPGDFVALRDREQAPPLFEQLDENGDRLEVVHESAVLFAIRPVPVPENFQHMLADPRSCFAPPRTEPA